jgi:hypothetical protein
MLARGQAVMATDLSPLPSTDYGRSTHRVGRSGTVTGLGPSVPSTLILPPMQHPVPLFAALARHNRGVAAVDLVASGKRIDPVLFVPLGATGTGRNGPCGIHWNGGATIIRRGTPG